MKKKMNYRALFQNQNYGNGLRYVMILVLAVTLTVGINVLAATLPTRLINIDNSSNRIHSISDETVERIAQLDKTVSAYLVCEAGEEDAKSVQILNLFADASDHLTVSTVDPAISPDFVQQYTREASLRNNSIIVVSGNRNQILDYADYYSGNSFVLEDYMVSAIDYVTSERLDTIYLLTGHGEADLSDDVKAASGLDGFQLEPLNMLQKGKIPEDACGLVINGPTADLTAQETESILQYMDCGGRLVLVTGYTTVDMPNLESIARAYGITIQDGYIVEGNPDYYAEETPSYIFPHIYTDHNDVFASGVEYVLLPSAVGLRVSDDVRDTLEITPLLGTSEEAESLTNNIFTGNTGREPGPFYLAMSAEEKNDQSSAKLVVFSSRHISDPSVDARVGGGNITMFLNTLCWACKENNVASIHGKVIASQFLTLKQSELNLWRYVMVFILPIIVLAAGGVICIRRKRR